MKTMILKVLPVAQKAIKKYQTKITYLLSVILLITGVLLTLNLGRTYLNENEVGFNGGGYDFVAYYSAAYFSRTGEVNKAYESDAMEDYQSEIMLNELDSQGYMAYLNPPYFAYILLPLSFFSIADAQFIWLLITLALSTFIALTLVNKINSKSHRLVAFASIMTLFPLLQNIRQGQLAVLLLLFIVLAIKSYEKNNLLLSGALLSALFIKPHLAVMAVIGLAIFKQWRVIKGMLVALIALIIIFLPFTGINTYLDYSKYLLGVSQSHTDGAGALDSSVWEGSLARTYGINGMITKTVGQENNQFINFVTLVILLILIKLIALVFYKTKINNKYNFNKEIVVLIILLGLLINLHLYAYDLAYLLVVPLIYYRKAINIKVLLAFLIIIQLSAIDYLTYLPVFTVIILSVYILGTSYIIKKTSQLPIVDRLKNPSLL